MATQTTDAVRAEDEAALAGQIRVAVPEHTLRSDLRAASIVWRREMIRFRRDRLRAVTSLIQPLLFLLVLGTGLSALASHSLPPDVSFKSFIYPGVLAMSVLFTAIFSAASIVWDREFGFLREMLVAPVSRSAIVTGKILGGATIATIQRIIMLALAGLMMPWMVAMVAPPRILPVTMADRLTGATSISRRNPNSRSQTIEAAEKMAVNRTDMASTPG